jgi:hypothetical protein
MALFEWAWGIKRWEFNRRLLRSTQMEKTSNPISAFHGADTDNSLPLKLGFFETEPPEGPLSPGN